MEDAKEVEVFIFQCAQNGADPSFIADELLKLWDKDKLSLSAKLATGSFCIANGYILSLIKALREDLKENRNTYWPLHYYFVQNDSKQINDAFLIAASQSEQLISLSLFAHSRSQDSRWNKILREERAKKYSQYQIEISDDSGRWPELKKRIEKIKKDLDMLDCSELSVGLSEMGLNELALEVLNYQKDGWSIKERFMEVDFLLKANRFIEALEKAQIISKENSDNSEVLKAALYLSAQAYYGLDDKEQAVGILKAIEFHDPQYRNLQELIRVWESTK